MKNNRKRDFISARDFRWFTWTLTLIFSFLRSFILKITSPNNSEDHSFYKHFKRFAVRPLSDLKLPRSAGVLKSYLKLFKILKTAQLLSKFSNSLSKWAFKKLWMSKYSHCEYFQSTLSENHYGLVEHFSNHSGNRTYNLRNASPVALQAELRGQDDSLLRYFKTGFSSFRYWKN